MALYVWCSAGSLRRSTWVDGPNARPVVAPAEEPAVVAALRRAALRARTRPGPWLRRPPRPEPPEAPSAAPSKARLTSPAGPTVMRSAGSPTGAGGGRRRPAGQREEGQLLVELAASQPGRRPTAGLVGVAPDPQPVGGGGDGPRALAPVPAGVPGQGEAAGRVEGGDALPGHAPGAGLRGEVGAVGSWVVQPAGVAADVDRGAGDGHGGEAVAAAVVGPGRLEGGAPG